MPSDLVEHLTRATCALVAIPSTESRPADREACFAFCQHYLESLPGIKIELHETHGHTSMVALPQNVTIPRILLVGHLDVVEHADPLVYQPTVREGRIWGPGAGDMKGQCAIMLELFVRLQTQHPGLSFGIALTSDEERGGEDGVRYLFEDVGLRCETAIVPDGGSLNAVTVAEKGILQLRLLATGKEGHAAAPWLSSNALVALTRAITDLCAHFDGLQDPASPDHWYPTCAPTICHTANPTVNCIPGTAEAVLDIRFPSPHTVDGIHDAVRQIIGPGISTETLASAPPTELAPDSLYIDITRRITGQPVRLHKASGGSDALFISQYGIPVILTSPLVGGLHRVEEWIDIASMETYYHICEQYILQKLAAEVEATVAASPEH